MEDRRRPVRGPLGDADIRLLRVFRAISEAGGLAAAERRLNLGRSTISTHLSELETRLGVVLCRRGRSGFALTEDGQAIDNAAKRLFMAVEAFRAEAAAGRTTLSGELRLGFVEHSTRHPGFRLSQALSSLKDRAPAVRISLEARSNEDIEAGVLGGALDVGILILHRRLAALRYEPMLEEVQGPYCARGHPLFEVPDRSIGVKNIASCEYVGRSYLDEQDARRRYLGDEPSAVALSLEAVITFVLTGRYIGIMPTDFAKAWADAGAIRMLAPKLTAYRRSFMIVTRKGVPATPVVNACLEALRAAHARGDQRRAATARSIAATPAASPPPPPVARRSHRRARRVSLVGPAGRP